MLKFTFKLSKSLFIFFGRVFLIVGGLVFYSSANALISFISNSDSNSSENHDNGLSFVTDEQSAQMAFDRGEISEAELVYWQEDK